MKVRLAKINMEGATIHWYNLLREIEKNLTWEKLKQALIDRNGGRQSDNLFEELKDLQQEGSVEDYISAFEYITSQVRSLSEEQYLGYFLEGLKPKLRMKAKTFNPHSRLQEMKLARDMEDKLRGTLLPQNNKRRFSKAGREVDNKFKFKTQHGSNDDSGPTKDKSGYDSLLGTQLQTG